MLKARCAGRPWAFAAMLLTTAFAAGGCEDPVPTDYIPEYVVTAYLIVDEPVRGITLARSQSVVDSFDYAGSAIRDASMKLISGSDTLDLVYVPNSVLGEYRYPDTTLLIEPKTMYRLEIRLADGSEISGQTLTPERISWIAPPADTLQYPFDTINLPVIDSLEASWTRLPNVDEYLISLTNLDTLDYGRYLTPPREEKNRRVENLIANRSRRRYNETTRWAFLQNTTLPTFWYGYKWYGLHEISVYAPDNNFIEWFKQTRFGPNQYNPLLGSVKGGVGVVGSASVVRHIQFLYKNRP